MSIQFRLLRFKSLLFLLFFISSYACFAQKNEVRITWDSQVACRAYGYEGHPYIDERERQSMIFHEGVDFGPCLRFCSGEPTTFIIRGNNISHVNWNVAGDGKIIDSRTNQTTSYIKVEWNPSGKAQIIFEITFRDGEKKKGQLCVELISSPKADFELSNQRGGKYLEACLETDLTFINTSDSKGGPAIVAYEWDFGNGDFSYTQSPVYQYKTSGNFLIRLKVTNECGCTDIIEKPIIIEPIIGVKIECPAVVCENAVARYTTNSSCGGHWQVEGGTIVNQSSNYIDVIWNQVDREKGFGYVHYFNNCGCNTPTTVKVPVILNSNYPEPGVKIKGEDTICVGSHSRYTIPQWPSTTMVWTLTPPTGAQVIYTDQRNEIIVKGLVPGVYELKVDYKNTLLGCMGRSYSKYITVLDKPTIIGEKTLCEGMVGTYSTVQGTPVNWKVYVDGDQIYNTINTTLDYNFQYPGTYTIVAGGSGQCEGEPYVITVLPNPPKPSSISGTIMVCPGKPYEYKVANTNSNIILEWDVIGGIIQGAKFGNNTTIIFNSTGPYVVKVRAKNSDAIGCLSNWTTLNIKPMDPAANIVNMDNLASYCPSSTTKFKVDMASDYTAQHIEWEFVPNHFGNIISGKNSNQVEVSLNEPMAGNHTGTLIVKLTHCNQIVTYSKTITLFQLPTITFPNNTVSVCSGDNFTLQFNSNTPIRTAQVIWEWNTGETFTQNINSSTGVTSVTSPNMSLSNLGNTPITRNVIVKVSNINSCNGTTEATRSITVNPKPEIQITPAGTLKVCTDTGAGFPLTLTSNFVSGTSANITWYRNGSTTPVQIGGNSLIITVNNPNTPVDTYYAVASMPAPNTCTATSNSVKLEQDCPYVNVCDQLPETTPTLSIQQIDCNTYKVSGNYSGTPSNIVWSKNGYLTLVSSTNKEATFTTTTPGNHTINYTIEYLYQGQKCTKTASIILNKPYEADFTFDLVCPTTGNNQDVKLIDNSQYLSEVGVTYQYYKNNIAITGATTKNFTDTNLPPGSYTYMLRIEKSGEKPCYKTKTIVVKGKPNALFTMTYNPACAETPIVLTQAENNPGYTYKWEFGDSKANFIGSNPIINLEPSKTLQSIKLLVTDPYGCTATHTVNNIKVNKADFSAARISSSNGTEFCQSGSTVLSLINTIASLNNIQWMNGYSIIPGATGLTYTATQTGDYWAMLYDNNGCSYSTAQHSIGITVKALPTVSLVTAPIICEGDPIVIDAIVSDQSVQRRWLRNGLVIHNWSTSTPLTITQNEPIGTYTYTIEVRDGSTLNACTGKASTVVTVNAIPGTPGITAKTISCMPYRVELTASVNPTGGTFNWSNGDTGQTIVVSDGGAYAVNYTSPSGCSNNASIFVPKMPEAFLWEVPTGCVNLCNSGSPYLLGPWLQVNGYKWSHNNNTVQAGTNPIQALNIYQPGEYRLSFNVGGCSSITDPLYFQMSGGPCNNSSAKANKNTLNSKLQLLKSDITIHPNPAITHATLDYNVQSEQAVNVQVYLYSVLGVQLWSENATSTIGSFTIPVTTLASGQYLVVVYINGQRYYENSLIKK